MHATPSERNQRVHVGRRGLSVLLITVSSLYFLLCLPGLHSDEPAHLGELITPSPSAAAHVHAPAEPPHGDTAVNHLPHAPHGDCGDSAVLPSGAFCLSLLLLAVLLVSEGRAGVTFRLHLLIARCMLRRRSVCCRLWSGIRLLNVLCVARL